MLFINVIPFLLEIDVLLVKYANTCKTCTVYYHWHWDWHWAISCRISH